MAKPSIKEKTVQAVAPDVDKPVETVVDKPVETPPEKPVETPPEKPAAPVVDKPVETPPEKPVETPPEKPVETATVANIDDLVDGEKPAEISDAGVVTDAQDLLGESSAPSQPLPSSPSPAPVSSDTKGQGCQCQRCKDTGGNKDKRGRHHAACNCNPCKVSRGEQITVEAIKLPDAPDNPFKAIAEVAQDDSKKFRVMAEMTFDSCTGMACMIFGPEWQPQNEQERANVSVALANYYRVKGVQDLPPGVVLGLVCLAYAAPRFAHKNTQSRMVLIWHWSKVKLSGLFAWFKKKK